MWPSLSVDETLRLVAGRRRDVDRVYTMFPRLAERRGHGGAQLSGGEQQMLAIGRALLLNPKLLVMDEPTEGLAPVIVEQVAQALRDLAAEGEIAVLLIEQNLGVAISVADRIGVMVNGRIAQEMPAAQLAADRELQERLLGVRAERPRRGSRRPAPSAARFEEPAQRRCSPCAARMRDGAPSLDDLAPSTVRGFTRWNAGGTRRAGGRHRARRAAVASADAPDADAGRIVPGLRLARSPPAAFARPTWPAPSTPRAASCSSCASAWSALGLRVVTVDLSTSGKTIGRERASARGGAPPPAGRVAPSSAATAAARSPRWRSPSRPSCRRGATSAASSPPAAPAAPRWPRRRMRALPIGVPKVMVSTMASGDTRPYVGPSDICMMYSVTDVQGINRISEKRARQRRERAGRHDRPPAGPIAPSASRRIGLTMFGVTTPCVQAVAKRLEDDYDCLVFHATGVGGQSMEKLADSGLLAGVIDVSTTEIADEIVGGVLSAGPTRMDVFARHALPYVGSCGALDMVNFGAWDTVPERFKARKLYRHNPTVTLMRTTADECRAIGEFIAAKLNAMRGPVRFLIPEGGVSAIDRPGQPFHDPEADRALFAAIEQALPQRHRPQAAAPAAAHQRRGLRRCAGRMPGTKCPGPPAGARRA